MRAGVGNWRVGHSLRRAAWEEEKSRMGWGKDNRHDLDLVKLVAPQN